MRIRQALHDAIQVLEAAGVPDARLDAGWLLEELTGVPRLALSFSEETFLQSITYQEWIERRAAGEPLQYILRYTDFFRRRFAVGPGVLIPRQETEILCEAAVHYIGDRPLRVLDLCTGSGVLAITFALNCRTAEVHASDISPEALCYARANAAMLDADVVFWEGDLFNPFDIAFDLIVSNPPYICRDTLTTLQREIAYEPNCALDGGVDGLDFYRRIAEQAPLKPGGMLLLEIGADQGTAVTTILGKKWTVCERNYDYHGILRVVGAMNAG